MIRAQEVWAKLEIERFRRSPTGELDLRLPELGSLPQWRRTAEAHAKRKKDRVREDAEMAAARTYAEWRAGIPIPSHSYE